MQGPAFLALMPLVVTAQFLALDVATLPITTLLMPLTPMMVFTFATVTTAPVLITDGSLTFVIVTVDCAATGGCSTATGTVGTITYDNDYIYVCIATDTWKRVAISTW